MCTAKNINEKIVSSSQYLQEGRKSGLEAHNQEHCPKLQLSSSLRKHCCDHWVWPTIPATYNTDTFWGMLSIELSLETEKIPIKALKGVQSSPSFFAVTGFQFKIGEEWHRGERELVGLEEPEAQADAQASLQRNGSTSWDANPSSTGRGLSCQATKMSDKCPPSSHLIITPACEDVRPTLIVPILDSRSATGAASLPTLKKKKKWGEKQSLVFRF